MERVSLSVELPAELSVILSESVKTGEYPDIEAALTDALATWARRHEKRAEELA